MSTKGITKQNAAPTSLKARSNKKNQVFRALLDNPYTQSNTWPFVTPSVAKDVLDLMDAILRPIVQEAESISQLEWLHYGFNSTVETLERQAANNRGKHKDSVKQIKYLIVCKYDITPQMLTSMFPVLSFTASKSASDMVKLVQLPKGSMETLSKITGVANTGILGLSNDVTSAEPIYKLIDENVKDVEIPWLNDIFDSPGKFYQPRVKQLPVKPPQKKRKKKSKQPPVEENA
ncbi:POP3 [Candida theae]|uniref:POP3 n=1 Tax=Candida theae TaxID=1198502 RepID=A0AAD5BGR6_9ASCO|nr:POP3 [Candida theae]KAI5961966.1 POP3 [Candida theae]